MSRILVKTDAFILFCFFIIFALIYAIGIIHCKWTLSQELKKSAFDHAERWTRYLETDPGRLVKLLSGNDDQTRFTRQSDNLSLISDIFHYELYNLDGDLVYVGGSKLDPSAFTLARPVADYSVLTSETYNVDYKKVILHGGDGISSPKHYAVVRVAFYHKGQPIGIAASYVNQTKIFESLSSSYNCMNVFTSIFFFIGMAGLLVASGFGLWRILKAEAHFKILESCDRLTGLDNRDTFLKSLTKALLLRRSLDSHLVVICLDIDRFKELNDSLSHAQGDSLLVDLAHRLKEICRDGDIVARLSGDEFAIACLGLSETSKIRDFISHLQDELSRPYELDGESVVCTLSMGVSIAPPDGDTASILLKSADLALCRSKSEGRNTYRFFDKKMDQNIRQRRTLAHQLKQAVNLDQLEIYFQPQIELSTGRLAGTEALLRWNHPSRGVIGPSDFIAIAEKSGQMSLLGEWILRSACMSAEKWDKPYTIAVNISPTQLHNANISELVSDVLMETGLEPHRLELEITESQLMNNIDIVVDELSKLKSIGVKLAIDDFGSGYSSLGYLSRFNFDKIKIDKCFVKNLKQGAADLAIVKTIIGLGRALNVTITAEGVETPEQADILKTLGCHQVQGFLYGYPETVETFNRLLADKSEIVDSSSSHFAA